MEHTRELINRFIQEEILILGVFGDLRKKSSPCKKVSLRPVVIKEDFLYQVEYHFKDKVTHENITPSEVEALAERLIYSEFKQLTIFAKDGDYTILANKPSNVKIIRKDPTKEKADLSHNKERAYILPEGQPCDFLIRLGVMTIDGQIVPKHRNKFRQINRFLEIVEDCLPLLPSNPTIIDFGCGKSYLTFALYHYLNVMNSYQANLVGLDLKEDVIVFCSEIAKDLNYAALQFKVGNIADYEEEEAADMVVTLHACDTATDFALMKSVKWNANVVLSVPCCQHELFAQLENFSQKAILKHGILKDRFAALLTDSLRALKMEEFGYSVSMIEFTSLEHTAKNIMLRCLKVSKSKEKQTADAKKAEAEFKALCEFWNVKPTIAQLAQRC
ncbi:MAG: SAM-dependent methyltransferase [Clostridia bacterium]|nr:SAM-dependent methyltransferase [Clostridia bacterium]